MTRTTLLFAGRACNLLMIVFIGSFLTNYTAVVYTGVVRISCRDFGLSVLQLMARLWDFIHHYQWEPVAVKKKKIIT